MSNPTDCYAESKRPLWDYVANKLRNCLLDSEEFDLWLVATESCRKEIKRLEQLLACQEHGRRLDAERDQLIAELTLMNHECNTLSLGRIEKSVGIIQNELAELLRSRGRLATKEDLGKLEAQIMAFEDDELAAINALSTTADTVSLKVDKVQADVDAIVTILKNNPGQPSQALVDAINKAKTSNTALAAAGDKLDAAVAEADAVLPAPAPAGTP